MPVRRRFYRLCAAVGCALLSLVGTAGCGDGRTSAERAAAEGILLLGNNAEPQSLDPHKATAVALWGSRLWGSELLPSSKTPCAAARSALLRVSPQPGAAKQSNSPHATAAQRRGRRLTQRRGEKSGKAQRVRC